MRRRRASPPVGRRREVLESVRAKLANPDRHAVYALDVNDHHALREAAHDFINRCGKVHVVIAECRYFRRYFE